MSRIAKRRPTLNRPDDPASYKSPIARIRVARLARRRVDAETRRAELAHAAEEEALFATLEAES